jgi:hypothetical protein
MVKEEYFMNKSLLVGLALVFLVYVPCLGNPLPAIEVESIHVNPPQIGLTCYAPSVDISGRLIVIDSDTAIVNEGTIIYNNWPSGNPFILDSSNTTGFSINPDGSDISLYLHSNEWSYDVSFGQKGASSAIIEGHYIKKISTHLDHIQSLFTYEFAEAFPGRTKVVINEINAGGTWDRCGNFIELFNRSNNPIDLASWHLISDTILSFPASATIPGHGFYVIDECDLPARFHVYMGSDNLYLFKGDTLVDQVGWSSNHGANVSFMRFPDGDADTIYGYDFLGYDDSSSSSFENGFPSRGASNRHETPGFVAIGARADSINFNIARINWTNPIWDIDFSTAIVVRSELGYVNNPADGQIVYEGLNQTYMDGNLFSGLTYYYTIFARKHDNTYSIPTSESQTSIILHSSSITEKPLLPADFQMSCYPNPFNAQTMISFTLPAATKAKIAIYDITGRIIDIVADRLFQAGQNSVIWNAINRPSGVYFYSIKTDAHSQAKTVVLMK